MIGMRVAAAAIGGAVMILAGSPAALAGPVAPNRAEPVKVLTSKQFAATVSVPRSWTKTPYMDRFAYDGRSGFISLNAASEPKGLKATCQTFAEGGRVHIFGTHPRLIFRAINGRPGCVILPSKDAPRLSVRRGGPKFQTSEAFAAYRHPLSGYPLFVIFADPAHVMQLADSVRLHH
ncbi:MAG TPA: hypothetical protein VE733_13500 [Streptosporangiaceae bacterium]|jgi:hypothetical protein|nr:hypothetical protein [Streptosporangiaceae bacterium]